jgi:hypothetical protein
MNKLVGFYTSVTTPTIANVMMKVRGFKMTHDHYEKVSWAKSVTLVGYEQFDFFVSYARFGLGKYAIFEGKSGKFIGDGSYNTIKETIDSTKLYLDNTLKGNLSKLTLAIDLNIKDNGGISPRYKEGM